jgi:hypothetical protein
MKYQGRLEGMPTYRKPVSNPACLLTCRYFITKSSLTSFPTNRTREGKFYLDFQLPDDGDGFSKKPVTLCRAETNPLPIRIDLPK